MSKLLGVIGVATCLTVIWRIGRRPRYNRAVYGLNYFRSNSGDYFDIR